MTDPEYRYAYVQFFETLSEAQDVCESFIVKLLDNDDYRNGRIFAGIEDTMVYVTVLWISKTDCKVQQVPGKNPELLIFDRED